jgi:hypothetical protein
MFCEAQARAWRKRGGRGGNSASPEPKRSRAALLVKSRVPQKSFLFLLEEKEIACQIKKCEENFFAEQRAKRAAAGRSELVGIFFKMSSDFFQQTPLLHSFYRTSYAVRALFSFSDTVRAWCEIENILEINFYLKL